MSKDKIKEININDSKINIADVVEIKENNRDEKKNELDNTDIMQDINDAPTIDYTQEDVEGETKKVKYNN